MAADRALAEQDQAAGEDVGAFDGDADRDLLVGAAEEVLRAEADALAADHVHAVVHRLAGALGDVVLDDRRHHRGLLAEVDRAGGHHARGVGQIGVRADAGECFLHALEAADRGLELVAHAGIGADGTRDHLLHAGVGAGQRDTAPGGQALHQHAPALAGHLRPADDELERHEHVLAAHRAVHPHRVEREVAAADVDARVVMRDQRAGDAEHLLTAEQALRVIQVEGQPEHGANRRERDVALVEIDAHAEHFLAVPLTLADHAGVGNGGGVGARPRAGERKGRDLLAGGQARQVVLLLLGRAVVQQQLGRAERVGHHHGDRGGGGARRQLGDHLGVRIGREALAAVLLGNDHAEETLGLDVLPDLGGHVAVLGAFPVAREAAELVGLVVEEGLLLGGELGPRVGLQLFPVGIAGEELAFPPNGAGLERVLFGLRHRGQRRAEGLEDRRGDPAAAQRIAQEHPHRAAEYQHRQQRPPEAPVARPARSQQPRQPCHQPGKKRRSPVGERACQGREGNQQDPQHRHLLVPAGRPAPRQLIEIRRSRLAAGRAARRAGSSSGAAAGAAGRHRSRTGQRVRTGRPAPKSRTPSPRS